MTTKSPVERAIQIWSFVCRRKPENVSKKKRWSVSYVYENAVPKEENVGRAWAFCAIIITVAGIANFVLHIYD
jgi:hypothetical protein